jgi:phosphoglucosamine mutase
MTGKLFGTTGVRKVYGTEFDIQMALDLGKALGTYLRSGTVLVAHDARTTGKMVADTMASGILSTGVNVVRAGMVPTPTLAFLTKELGYDAGVMVTASHNPPEYTGIKFWGADSMGFAPETEAELEKVYLSGEFTKAPWDALGKETSLEGGAERHISSLLEQCSSELIRSKAYTVVVDPGNGAACVLTPYLMQRLGCKVIGLNSQPDGHFPGRKSEPEEESLGDLIKAVKDTGADLGIAHDGDADRVVFVTGAGEVIRGDRTIALLARETMAQGGSKTVVTTVDSSLVLDETVQKAGGRTERTPVGDIQVSMKVKELGAVHGGEACGVYVFPEYHLAPEPFLAACKVLELMAKTGKSFAELIGDIPVYPLLKAKVRVPNEKKQAVMEALAKELPSALGKVVDVLTVDGLGIFLENGWVLVRPSGTEPVIRITCEASSQEIAKKILADAEGIVSRTASAHTH